MSLVQICTLMVYCLIAGLTIAGYAKNHFWLRAVNKSLLIPSLICLYIAASKQFDLWILTALVFGWMGDVFLLGKKTWNRIGGLASFAAGHVCYLIGMLHSRYYWGIIVPISLCWQMLMIMVLWKTAISKGPRFYRICGLCYAILLSGISAAAMYLLCTYWFTWQYCLCFLGTVAFIASDGILMRGVFGLQSRRSGVWVMVLYIVAQTALAMGFALHGGI